MTQPALHVVSEGGESVGKRLAAARRRSGLSLEQVAAATRVRRHHLELIERDDLGALPGPVYSRGYVRAYADYLGIEVELPAAAPPPARPALSLGRLAPLQRRQRLTLSRPLLAGAGLALGAGLFVLYGWHEMESASVDGTLSAAPAAVAASPPPIASPLPAPSLAPSAAPTPAPIAVALRATEHTWVTVTVDGKAAFGGFLDAGGEVDFSGRKVRVSSGKPSLEVSVGGGEFATLGVLNKEYSADT